MSAVKVGWSVAKLYIRNCCDTHDPEVQGIMSDLCERLSRLSWRQLVAGSTPVITARNLPINQVVERVTDASKDASCNKSSSQEVRVTSKN